ncbi:ryanodine receptor 2-like [Oncorhynchus keta]|uniref:ryanodine receptor 2-like n=1 Tax=Oncorhynchus keta TaxID=8018 RepID=UPI00227D59AF|nr:ryanodine receptor 2-like [Oncorhynchus keta]
MLVSARLYAVVLQDYSGCNTASCLHTGSHATSIVNCLHILGQTLDARQRPALGECLAAFSGAFPVAFLEPELNQFNNYSIYITKGSRDRTALDLPFQVGEMCPVIPSLEKSLEEIMDLAESGLHYTQMPHVMEVVLPMLCSYMSHWWEHGFV